MFKGFRDFIMRGNVVDLAVGIVIGAAFTALVTSFTTGFLKPLIARFSGGTTVSGSTGLSIGHKQILDWPGFINAIITFLMTAAVLYFLVVLPMNKLAERRKRGQEPPPAAPSEEIMLLTQIRDALLQGAPAPVQRGSGEAADPAPSPRPHQ